VVVIGLLPIGTSRVFVSIGLRPEGLSVVQVLASNAQRRYQAPAGSATITSTDGHADGEAIEQDATPPHTIRVVGDVTCGTPVS
jgi:hypothetical protein